MTTAIAVGILLIGFAFTSISFLGSNDKSMSYATAMLVVGMVCIGLGSIIIIVRLVCWLYGKL